ncbi:hypothetical protein AX15_001594 [Amanita polypyramis BW_CC]|nr:hypothetical protein AX15_001594 [Amanita polypyramis BW_CC]
MEKTLQNKVEVFRKSATKAGEELVFTVFPRKILELSELLGTTSNTESPFHMLHAPSFTDATVYPHTQSASDEPLQKKRKLNGGNETDEHIPAMNDVQSARLPSCVHANHHIVKLHEFVKKECEQLVNLIDQVKLWVTLTMPKIEDGDNFGALFIHHFKQLLNVLPGVQIQEEVLGELHRAQESGYNLRDAARQDYLARAKICSKLIKYPNVEDYTLALQEHDGRQLYLARQNLTDIRNMYAVLTDLIHKNISKIRAPKANNSVGLY